MIDYDGGAFGINLLLKAHGSAVYRATLPGLISVLNFLTFTTYMQENDNLGDPYAVGVLVSGISFLIIFRANHGYQRYWEAAADVHHMMSKWLDGTVHAGVYHMQCSHYESIKPPNYFDNHELNGLGLSRNRELPIEKSASIGSFEEKNSSRRSINHVVTKKNMEKTWSGTEQDSPTVSKLNTNELRYRKSNHLYGIPRLDGGWKSQTFTNENAKGRPTTPSLYLQELCHLSSLLVAVAFSTLRNDINLRESPLEMYIPNSNPADWPPVDPNDMSQDEKRKFLPRFSVVKHLRHWLGLDRTLSNRAKYYAARPMQVLGGVSDAELHMLRRAKGASAKVNLAWTWLSDFMIREHLAGSMGNVASAIVSRCFQFLSDGMIFYNQARKIMLIPFPYPHAQLSAFFIVIIVFAVPFMLEQYAGNKWVGALLTFLTVVCLGGMHEVARELENPFKNMPNDLPLCTLLAMYNEALITMYFGYHPDAFYDPAVFIRKSGTEDGETANAHEDQPLISNIVAHQLASVNVTCHGVEMKPIFT